MKNSENHIVHLMRIDPERAVRRMYDSYSSALYGVLLKMTVKEHLAQEALQDAFVKIFHNCHKYDEKKSKLFTWMLRIARNAAIDRLRKENRIKEDHWEEGSHNHLWSERPVSSEYFDLPGHVQSLAPKYSSVIELFYLNGYTHQETSEALELPLGTVKTRIRAGLDKLRKIYSVEMIAFILTYYII